jgi:hypothetical protein
MKNDNDQNLDSKVTVNRDDPSREPFSDAPLTGVVLREFFQNGGSGVREEYLDAVEEAKINKRTFRVRQDPDA